MRLLHFALTLGVALLSCGQLQAAFLFNLNNPNNASVPQSGTEKSQLGGFTDPLLTALEYGSVFQVVANPDPNPLAVSALGFFDYGGDGLVESHTVQLFHMESALDANGHQVYDLIAQTTIDAGTTDTLIDGFRYAPISSPTTPVTLTAGDTYLLLASVGKLVGDSPQDLFEQFTQNVVNVPNGPLDSNFVPGDGKTVGVGLAKSAIDTSGFTVGTSKLYNPTSGDPDNSTTTFVQPGENFPFLVNLEYGAVPEPSSILVWSILGALGFVCVFKRRGLAV